MKRTAKDTQHGGTWYKTMKIQPIDFIIANELNWFQGNALKYLCRHKLKGQEEDLKKAIHYLQMLIEHQYKITSRIEYDDEKPTASKCVHRVRRKTGPRVQGVSGEPATNNLPTFVNLPTETPNT